MSADVSLEFALPRILRDLGEGAEPDYVDDLLARTAQLPQRHVFSVVPRARVPWQLIAAAALLTLALAAAAIFAGSRKTETAPLTGPAGNGQIAYVDWKGDLFLGNPRDGSSTLLVDNPELGVDPVFSPDGTRIAFVGGTIPDPSLFVVRSDGSGLEELGDPIDRYRGGAPQLEQGISWTADASAIIYGTADRGFQLFDLDPAGRSRSISDADADALRSGTAGSPGMSPAGDRQLLYDDAGAIAVRETDGAINQIVGPSSGLRNVGAPTWSPDGALVLFEASTATHDGGRVFVIRPDGTGLRQLSTEASFAAGDGDIGAQWSTDGSFIAAERTAFSNLPDSARRRGNAPVGFSELVIFDVASGEERPVVDTRMGTLHSWWGWSPDGQRLLVLAFPGSPIQLVDPATGRVTDLPWATRSAPSWQRVAVP
ncbi:MAG TPA: hypothetical protein VFV72_08260 [Candidatus Limnocylindrales bacterium]|nr:hypothetical protein [Candidatus Limnocylindrales bacterium]